LKALRIANDSQTIVLDSKKKKSEEKKDKERKRNFPQESKNLMNPLIS